MIIQASAISQLPEINADVFTIILLSSSIPIVMLVLYVIKILPSKHKTIKYILKFYIIMIIIIVIIGYILTIFTDIQLCQGFYELYG